MDYSYVPQMYQQGVTHNLDKQFQLAGQAQPVTQFLASLRQAKQMELQQQMEEDRQRRLDIEQQRADQQAQYQNANNQMGFMSHISQELTPGNAQSYRDLSKSVYGKDLVPQPTVIPGGDVAAQDYGPDQGSAELGAGSIPLTPGSTPAMSFSDIIKQPTGSRMQLQQDTLAAKERMATEKRNVQQQIEAAKIKVRQDAQAWRSDGANPQNIQRANLADKYALETQRIQEALDAGAEPAKVALMHAQAANAYASAQDHLSNASTRGTYTEGMQGRDAAAMERSLVGSDTRVAMDPLGRTITPIRPRGGGPPPPAVETKPLPSDLKSKLMELQGNPATKADGDAKATKLWNAGYRW